MLRRNYANTLIELERFTEVTAQLNEAGRLEPDSPYLALHWAELAKAQGDRPLALHWAAEALRRQPGWEEAEEIGRWAGMSW